MALKLKNFSDSKFDFEELNLSYYNTRRSGSFALLAGKKKAKGTVSGWMKCRDAFQTESYRIDKFLYCSEKTRLKNIAAFIQHIEDKLDVTPKTEFGPTNQEDVVWVKPSRWWTNFSMRRSLFTILLRAGKKFNRKTFNVPDVIEGQVYLKNTAYAVNWFLEGNTSYRGKMTGWYNQFYYGAMSGKAPSQKKVRELLVKP